MYMYDIYLYKRGVLANIFVAFDGFRPKILHMHVRSFDIHV